MGFLKDLLISWGIIKETKTEAPTSTLTEKDLINHQPQVAQFDELDNVETLNTKSIDAEVEIRKSFESSADPSYGIDVAAELSKILWEEVTKTTPPINFDKYFSNLQDDIIKYKPLPISPSEDYKVDSELIQKSIEEESKNAEEIPTSDFISDYSDKAFVLYDPQKSVKENLQIKPNSRPRKEFRVPKPHIPLPTYIHKKEYDYEKPMVIKVTNLKNLQDTQIFVNAKQLCEHFGIKRKKLYICLNSINKTLDGKYELEIIPFMENHSLNLSETCYIDTTTTSNEETKIDTTVINIKIKPKSPVKFIDLDFKVLPTGIEFNNKFTDKKRKFISVAEKAPSLIIEWDEARNGVAATEIPYSIKKEAYWLCPKCGASYKRRIDNRTRRHENGCSKCFKKTSV